jgi:hypothetical protein
MRRFNRLGVALCVGAVVLLGTPMAAGGATRSSPSPPPDHWWQAEGNADDSAGTADGTLVGATFGPGVYGNDQAFSFGGGNDQVVFAPSVGDPGRAAFTYAFAIRTSAGGHQAVWEQRAACDSDGTAFWGFRVSVDGGIDFEGGNPTGPDYVLLGSTTVVDDGGWHRVALTRKQTTTRLYVDGRLEKTVTTPTVADITQNTPVRAGVSSCDGIDGTNAFVGQLDELMIFHVALNQSKIQALGT